MTRLVILAALAACAGRGGHTCIPRPNAATSASSGGGGPSAEYCEVRR